MTSAQAAWTNAKKPNKNVLLVPNCQHDPSPWREPAPRAPGHSQSLEISFFCKPCLLHTMLAIRCSPTGCCSWLPCPPAEDQINDNQTQFVENAATSAVAKLGLLLRYGCYYMTRTTTRVPVSHVTLGIPCIRTIVVVPWVFAHSNPNGQGCFSNVFATSTAEFSSGPGCVGLGMPFSSEDVRSS